MNTDQNKQPVIKDCIAWIQKSILLLFVSLPAAAIAQGVNMSDPIVMGTYNTGTYSYTDARNNSSYGNDYGQSSPDIYYKFIVTGVTTINISTCSSGWDTYVHLLDGTGALVLSNDDNGGACSGLTASIVIPSSQTAITSLAAGTYYIITEGYGSGTGLINLSVSLTVQPPPGPVTYNTRNFIRTWDATAPETDPNILMTRPVGDVNQTTRYLDGLGRNIQTVIKQASLPAGSSSYSDIVKTNVYDAFGREQYNYLPFPANSTGGNTSISDGNFKANSLDQLASFAQTQYPGDNFYYSKTNFEASPLSRVTDVYAPGKSWAGSETNADPLQRRNAKFTNCINSLADEVQIWAVTNSINNTTLGQFGTYSTLGTYQAGQLYKNIITDEEGRQVIEFKDKTGNIILNKKQLTAAADNGYGSGHSGWICTYYVYDDLNILRAVFQPKAVEWLLNHSWSFSSVPSEGAQISSELIFRYEYDKFKHLIKKQIPGEAEIWMVYDAKDKLVLTQDGNQRTNHQWVYMQYDDSNRPLATGLITDDANYNNLNFHLQQASTSIAYPNIIQYANQELTRQFYDNYDWRLSWGNPLSNLFDHSYDSYLNQAVASWPYPNPVTSDKYSLHGQTTGSRTKILGTTNYLFSVVFYDENGRLIQTQSQNITGGTDIHTTQYTWSGLPLINVFRQQKGGATNPQSHIVKTSVQYDKLFREIAISKLVSSNINNQSFTTPEVLIQKNKYDALGTIVSKEFGQKKDAAGNYTTTPVETLAFDYNIRGWLLGVNRAYIKNQSANYFGFELAYDNINNIIPGQTYAKPKYSANVTGTTWRGISDGEVRKYDFEYDATSRLLSADFKQLNGTAFALNNLLNFSMKIGDGITPASAYDLNGNILSVQQYGLKLNASPLVDDLRYTYQNGGRSNKLQNVIDRTNNLTAKLGDFTTTNLHPQYSLKQNTLTDPNTIFDYSYDDNGNLKFDNNKNIVNGANNAIEYNHLNSPTKVFVSSGAKGTIEYVYDASGKKLKKIVTDYTTANKKIITSTTYIGGFVYESKQTITLPSGPADPNDYTDRLLYFGHETGRIRLNETLAANPFSFDYFIKDNLGNIRMVLTDEQQKDIYPAATLEGDINTNTTPVGYEKTFYTINSSNIADNSEALGISNTPNIYTNNNGISNPYPQNNSGNTTVNNNSQKLYRLIADGTGGQTGLGIVLKVMSGDKIDILGKSYFYDNNTGLQNYQIPVSGITAGLFGAPRSSAGSKGITATDINNESVLASLISTFLTDPNRNNNGVAATPKAYINWILFDENFKMVAGNFSRVGSAGLVKNHFNDPQLQGIPVTKSGFLYVYVSNESPVKVFFDNLQVVHTRGAVLEENHYYPFGLVMSGISSKAAGKIENFYKYNGKEIQKNELSDGSGLDWYDYGMREYDAQIGRFFRIDPIAEKFTCLTPYQYASNDPIANIDIDGLEGGSSIRGWLINSSGLQNYDKPGGSSAFASSMAKTAATPDPYFRAIDGIGKAIAFVSPFFLGDFVPIGGGMFMDAGTVGAFERAGVAEVEAAELRAAGEKAAAARLSSMEEASRQLTKNLRVQNIINRALNAQSEAMVNGYRFFVTTGKTPSQVFNMADFIMNPNKLENAAAAWLQKEGTHNAKMAASLIRPGAAAMQDATPSMALAKYWPENGGALGEWSNSMSVKGQIMDRYGSIYGNYASPVGTPYSMRALSPATNPADYFRFEVLKPFPYEKSTIAPAFGQIGLGVQYKMPISINYLQDFGYIKIF
jgi:RHS repeat-associated protein